MDAISKAISEVKFRIPPQVLDLIFIRRYQYYRNAPPNLDDQILNLVVKPRVMIDSSLMVGDEALIPMDPFRRETVDDYMAVYRVPKSATANRTIISIKSITFVNPYMSTPYGNTGSCQFSHGLALSQNVLDAMSPVPQISTADMEIIGENVIMVRDARLIPQNSWMRCILTHDDQMSRINPRSYIAFAKLVELAVKSYIYNNHIVEMDMGELHGGYNLGAYRNIIESYADSEELYQLYLKEKWQKIGFMNDRERNTRHWRLLIGGAAR